jgi:hypothetical protein
MLMLYNAKIDLGSLGIDVLVLLVITTVLVSIGAALYPRIIQ